MTGLKPQAQPRFPAKGLLLLAIGRKTGFDHFGNDGDAYLASLAPLLALILVGSAWIGVSESKWRVAALLFLRLICLLLAPAVVAELYCRLWKRNGQWALYANLLNWSQWLAWFVLAILLFGAQFMVAAGLEAKTAVACVGVVGFGYLAWFHWFLARQTLGVSRKRVLLLLATRAAITLAIGAVSLHGSPGTDVFDIAPAENGSAS